MIESAVHILRAFASGDPEARANASLALIFDHEPAPGDDEPDAGRRVEFFEDAWRNFDGDRDATLCALVRAMADPRTSLTDVNFLAYAIASAGEDGATELLALLEHADFAVRSYAAEGLGSLDNRARWAVPALFRAFDRAGDGWPRWMILRALGDTGGAEAIALLQAVATVARSASPPDKRLLETVEGALASALTQAGPHSFEW